MAARGTFHHAQDHSETSRGPGRVTYLPFLRGIRAMGLVYLGIAV
jgi:hypothetical protein